MSRILRGIKYGLTHYPILTNSAIYGSMFVGAECINQTLSKRILNVPGLFLAFYVCVLLLQADNPKQPYDTANIKRCGVFGTLIQGPFMTVWYRWLDSRYVGTNIKIVARKVLMDQFLFTPVLYAVFYIGMSIMEGKSDVSEELIVKFPMTFITSCFFWLPVQSLNFAVISPIYRVTYMGFAAFAWVSILCWIKSQEY